MGAETKTSIFRIGRHWQVPVWHSIFITNRHTSFIAAVCFPETIRPGNIWPNWFDLPELQDTPKENNNDSQ